jgi:electron transfer flavoprotein beta subunit
MVDGGKGSAAGRRRTDGSPLVVACLEPADLRPEVNPLTGEVRTDRRRAALSAADEAALEYALRARDVWGGSVLAVAAGPASAEMVLRQARALGARVLRVPYGSAGPEGPEPISPEELAGAPAALARALARAIEQLGSPALVVCGDRSASRGIGAVPALLAHHLGASQALGLVDLSVDEASLTVRAERRLDGGWRERLRLGAPALCSVEAAGVRLRRATLAGTLGSGDEPIPVAAPPATSPAAVERLHTGAPRSYRPRTKVVPAPGGGTRERLLTLTGALTSHDPPRLIGPVGPREGADELLSYLAAHGYLPSGRIEP